MKKTELSTNTIFDYLAHLKEIDFEGKLLSEENLFEGIDSRILDFDVPIISFIWHYATNSLLYLEGNTDRVFGFNKEAFLEMNSDSLLDLVHPLDKQILEKKVAPYFLSLLEEIEEVNLKDWRFSVDYRIKTSNSEWVRVLQYYVIIRRDEHRKPLVSCGKVSDISNYKSGDYINFSAICYKGHVPDCNTQKFTGNSIEFSLREKEVLLLISQGLPSKLIADNLSLSLYTVHNHRARLLKKTGSKNTTELLKFAVLNDIF